MADANEEILHELKEIKKLLFLLFCQGTQTLDSLRSSGGPALSLKDVMADAATLLRGMADPY